MNNFNRCAVVLMLGAVLVIASIAGCSSDVGKAQDERLREGGAGSGQQNSGGGHLSSVNGEIVYHDPTDTVYVAQYVPFPDETEIVPLAVYNGDKLYFVSTTQYVGGEDEFFALRSDDALCAMNLDGSGYAKLGGYAPPALRAGGDFGSTSINGLCVDADGNIWVAERWEFYGYDLPSDFDSQSDSAYEYHVLRESGSVIRKLDAYGSELLTAELGESAAGLNDGQGVMSFMSIAAGGDGHIYVSAASGQAGVNVYALGSDGSVKFSLTPNEWVYSLVKMADGSVAFPTGSAGTLDRTLQKIDSATKSTGEAVALPGVSGNTMSGGSDFDALIDTGSDLYGFSAGGEAELLLNWSQCGIVSDYVQNIQMLPDGRIICTNYKPNRAALGADYELIVLSETTYSELPERSYITLATFGNYGSLEAAIADFNRTNPDITIDVRDYMPYDDRFSGHWQASVDAALQALATDLITGNLPDVLAVSELPIGEYAARGLFADLYPFIDSDPDYSRADFVDGAFRAAESGGKLFQVFPAFELEMLAGSPSVVGFGGGWTLDEFAGALSGFPNADRPLGAHITDLVFLQYAVSSCIDDYIDWDAGTVNFDSGQFTRLLEICKAFPKDTRDENGRLMSSMEYVPEGELIAAGRQFMTQVTLSDFFDIMYLRAVYGGELALKGYPSAGAGGVSLTADCSLAIIENSPNKDAAWAFVRTVLDKEWQAANCYSLPTHKAAFDIRVSNALDGKFGYYAVYDGLELKPLVQDDIGQVMGLISSASGVSGRNGGLDRSIWDIISEEASDYLSGVCSAADAARVIQSRISMLVAERS